MNKDILKKIAEVLKQNITIIIIFVIVFIFFTFQLPYYIETPGGIINTSERIDIDRKYKQKGSYNLAYVGELRATIAFLIYSKINKDWKVIPKNEVVLDNETLEEAEFREHLMLEEANNTAIKIAYDKADKEYNIIKNEMYITYIDEMAKTNMKIKDKIISIVINKGKKYDRYATIIKYKNKKMIGIIITEKQELETDPNIEIKFKNSESGASGGLMMSLSIYDSLIKEDLTKGLKIAGTGTIDENGLVGEIDGVKYKLIGAVDSGADLFLVPSGNNYKEAVKTKEEKGYKIKIIKIKTFDEAVKYLKKND